MPTQIQLRRGTTSEHSSFTGAAGEVTVDTTKKTLVVHDGSTAGGIPVAKENNATLTGSVTLPGTSVFNSTGLGIGTSSPAYKLHVVGTGGFANNGNENLFLIDTSGSTRSSLQISGATNYFNANIDSASHGQYVWRSSNAYTERMRLDASGNLGIGRTPTAGVRLDVENSADVYAFFRKTSGAAVAIYGSSSEGWVYTSTNHPLILGTNGSERARIDSSGNLMIGVTSPTGRLTLPRNNTISWANGATQDQVIYADNSSNLIFYTVSTERARITSGGDLLVGKNATGTANIGWEWYSTGGGRTSMSASANTTTTLEVYSTGVSAYRFYVGMGGTIYATSTTITAISDQRLKENIQDIDVGLDAIMALKPRKFDWKSGKGKNKKGDRGWIAQEFEQVFPDMIDTWADPAPEGEEPYKAVNADLIPILVKAIQELKAEFDAYKATHP